MSQNLQTEPTETITIKDFLDNMIKEETISLKILEKNESKTCTFSKGAINQTVFGCKTCSPSEPAGFCFGCYLSCHLDHDAFEIGLKKNFLCECGTNKLQNDCLLEPIKMQEFQNQYDHNFLNKFCNCNQEYDNKSSDFMISCIFCLDFYHVEHLKLSENEVTIVREFEDYAIMVCQKCLNGKMSFLLSYLSDKDVILPIINEGNAEQNKELNEKPEDTEEKKEPEKTNSNEIYSKRKEISKCPINEDQEDYEKPVFLKDNWFDNLCLCEKCLKLYKDLDLERLYKMRDENEIIVEEDLETNKENLPNDTNSTKPKPLYEESLKEFSKLDFMTQSNIANLYREFYSDFLDFSKPFIENNEIITKENIKEFFEQLKKKRIDNNY